jgi:crotonobetainyl-CoA:carnitine CoA-transferase CaiB-like acyl-CoA transferase
MGVPVFQGLKVIELASVLAGPAVGMFFAELGADVAKVENFRTGGDVTRSWKLGSESAETDVPAYFSAVNWGKRSIGIDLAHPQGQALVRSLLAQADVALLSFKPGDAARFGLQAADLLQAHPRLIVAEITAYGPDDPRVGYDAIIQAETGFTGMNGTPDSGPVKMPVALMDLLTAHQLKEGILVALWQRERTGKGSHVSASLVRSGIASLANQALNWLKGGHIPRRMGSGHPNIVPYGDSYPTADGKEVVLAIGSDKQFAKLCEVLGQPELATREDFATNAQRVRNREAVQATLREAMRGHTQAALLAALHAGHVPAGAVHDLREVFEMQAAQEMLLRQGAETGLRTVAFEGSEFGLPLQLTPPPHLCADTVSILTDAGFSEAEITTLREAGAVK